MCSWKGVRTYSPESGAGAQVMRRDETSGAPTLLYKVLVDRGISWGQACELLTETVAVAKAAAERAEVSS